MVYYKCQILQNLNPYKALFIKPITLFMTDKIKSCHMGFSIDF